MKYNNLSVYVFSSLILLACANPQTGGIGLRDTPPKPITQQDLTEQSQKMVDIYNSLTYLPEAGAERVSEFSHSVPLSSGDSCVYKVTETMKLAETDPEIAIQYKFDQVAELSNSVFCPPKDTFLVDMKTSQKFRDYANEHIARFYKFTDTKTYLEKYTWAKSAEVFSLQDTDFMGDSALKVRLKILEKNTNQIYMLQTIFSKKSSLLGILDQQLIRNADGKVMSYRHTLSYQ